MSYTLVGSRYIGTGSLPVPAAGYDACDTTTGNLYFTNAAGTAWVLMGNVNNANLGLLPLTGGTMTGAITGASSWAPNDSPNFTSSAKLDGVNLATTSDLTTTSTTILNSIAPKITEAVASTTSAISVKGNVAMASGLLTFTSATTQTIPLPVYSDGVTASESDCKWTVGLVSGSFPCGRADSNGDTTLYKSADPSTTRTFAIYLKDNGGNFYSTVVQYLIIGVRS